MIGGAWPFLVRGANCLVNSVNERDLNLLNSDFKMFALKCVDAIFRKDPFPWSCFAIGVLQVLKGLLLRGTICV